MEMLKVREHNIARNVGNLNRKGKSFDTLLDDGRAKIRIEQVHCACVSKFIASCDTQHERYSEIYGVRDFSDLQCLQMTMIILSLYSLN